MEMKRRTFLLGGSGLLMGATATSNQVVLGVIGSGGRGTAVMKVFQSHAEGEGGAICDVYEPNLERAIGSSGKDRPNTVPLTPTAFAIGASIRNIRAGSWRIKARTCSMPSIY